MNSKTSGKEDEDFRFLEQVLDKFYDFESAPASKKRSHKKKKRKRPEEEEEEEEREEAPAVEQICDATEDDRVACPRKVEPTGAAVKPGDQVEVVTFQDPRKKARTPRTPAAVKTPIKVPQPTEEKPGDQLEEISLEKARLEVHRFGITGYKKEQQRVFERDRAIMLGARPPKKEYVNYKLLQQKIVEKKQKAKEEPQPELKKKKKSNNQRDKKKSSSGPGSAPTGQVGRFKNGMLILSSKEIQTIKGKKRRR